MNVDVVDKIIDRYLKIVKLIGEPKESYKYDAINHFQENWDLESPNFGEMFKKSFAKVGNLLYQNSWGFIYKSAENFPKDVRKMFVDLYDENTDLEKRIINFQKESERLLPLLKERLGRENLNSQQDERTISVFLSFKYPEKYCIYKLSYFKEFCEEFKIDSQDFEKATFLTLQKILPQFHEGINQRQDFIDQYRVFYEKPQWNDLNLIVQNLLFVTYSSGLKGIYNGILKGFKKENLIEYFNYLDELIQEFNIKKGTQKCVFNVSGTQINFTIGQKYVWCLDSANGGLFKIISQGQFGLKSEKFNSSTNSYLNHIKDLSLLNEKQNDIDNAISNVIDKTVRSGYLKFNDPFIERMVFEKDFRSLILGVDFSAYNKDIQYWIFQGNPKYYDVVGALNADVLTNWKVGAHKNIIKKGDKVILWLTGENSGCYGLGITISDVAKLEMTQEESSFYKTDYDPNEDRVGLKITHKFSSKPILWKGIKDNLILSNLKVGNQGTNFTATKEQYDEILRISQLNQNKMNHPLNQILFGCPGSGKTYSTKKLAVEIIEDRKFTNTKEDRAEIIKLYDQYTEKNQIKFTTFHQSLSYEDFIEGIKPKTVNDQVIYEIENGIFNKISQKAQDNWLNSQTEENDELSFEDALSKLQDEWVEDNDIKFPLKTKGNEFTITGFNEKNLNFRKASGGTAHTLSFNTMKELYYGKRNHTNVGIGIYYPAIIERLRSYEGDSKPSKKLDNYVLIMDEINRGNISSIFGELITLIEDDKRLGSTEKIEVNLPYSKESFGVPPNLYLIGTMNTADRSVESLDTALRRRFSFTEMKSDPEVIRTAHENGGIIQESPNINLIELLDTINKRIELLVDKDHQIGHSYFIGVNTLSDLKVTFKNKIIPLLEEYFFGDFGKIGLVLGDQFVETNSAQDNKKILTKFKGYEDVDFLTDKKIYTFKDVDQMTANDFVSIYYDYNDQ